MHPAASAAYLKYLDSLGISDDLDGEPDYRPVESRESFATRYEIQYQHGVAWHKAYAKRHRYAQIVKCKERRMKQGKPAYARPVTPI